MRPPPLQSVPSIHDTAAKSAWQSPIQAINFLTKLSTLTDRSYSYADSLMGNEQLNQEQFMKMAEVGRPVRPVLPAVFVVRCSCRSHG